jgi:hypothetical protein
MIGLFTTRQMLTAAVVVAIAIFAVLTVSGNFTGSLYQNVWIFSKYVLGIPGALLIASHAAWRLFPSLQRATFPYLGGHWTGVLRYGPADAQELREANLYIKHGINGMSLVLDTRESTSVTLAVVATRDPTGSQYHVYYVFENRRKPEYIKPGFPVVYRGVAILKLAHCSGIKLSGEYFTDQPTRGVAEFELLKRAWF